MRASFVLVVALGSAMAFSSIGSAREPPEESSRGPPPTVPPPLPKSADLRPLLDRRGLAQRGQGRRDTCSVFVVTGALEHAAATRRGRGTRFSVEFLNWAANKVGGNAADGGFFSDLWNGYATHGICPEEDMPYRPQFDRRLQPDETALAHAKEALSLDLELHWIKEWDPDKGLTQAQLVEVKRALSRGWPVCGGFLWPKREEWKDGVLQICPREAVRDGHSVLLVGYREEAGAPGGGLFLIRNSSGPSRDGYLTFEYILTYMNDALWIGCEPGRPAHPVASAFADPLGALASMPGGRNRRISSNEQPAWNDGNSDMTPLVPGQVLELPVLEGPVAITHMWFTSHAGRVNELKALSIRIYWDGRSEPGVEAPLGDFFAVGQGKPAVVDSIPVQVSPTGALTCYWRMPFAKSARIVIANDNPDRTAGLYWQVDWVELASLPPETPYFHARYREEYPAKPGSDYLIADIVGTGLYVGTVLSVTLAQDGWFGEGDDFFTIDGESVPSLQGTGSEDYFNDAWGFRPRTGPWFGQPRWQGDRAGDSGVCYRWHVLDPIGFTKSLKVAIEHKGNHEMSEDASYIERPDFLSSVAFWYQTGEPKRFGELPAWRERRVPWQHHHLVQAFREAKATGSAKVQVETQGLFGARPTLAWPNTETGARLTLPFTVAEEGRHAVRLTGATAPGYGLYDVELDGKVVLAAADFRSRDDGEADWLLGTHSLAPGAHTLSFRALDTPGGGSRPMAVEMLRLLRLPPEATRKVKTEDEAHFIRLGIGRAVYAYRLAYGVLPDSLETLVKSGIMPERYTKDENGLPLAASLEGEHFVVKSTAQGGWTHRWQGLDARR